jgi:hypothetical protein
MSYWAEINENNIVLRVFVGDNHDSNGDEGYQWLINNLGGIWLKTSYNTRGGVHYNPETNEPSADQSKALRKNYAGIGYVYDESRDAFYAPQPYLSWTLNEDSCIWEAPIPYPIDDKNYEWNEENQSWDKVE